MIKASLFNKEELQRLFKADSYKETVISELFFTPRFVYKIKKPVNLGFLDFGDKKERFRITKYEFEVNKKFAPSIYLGLVPIRKYDGKPSLGSQGEILEYAVKMVRLPQSGQLSSLLAKSKVNEDLVRKIANTIARAHAKFPFERKNAKYGRPATTLKNLKQTHSLLRKDALGRFLTPAELNFCQNKSLLYFKKLVPEFKKRAREKRIQKIHGDLHSENIFVKNEIPYLTDAILPINEWAYGDCAYDLGALAMDFDAYQNPQLSKKLVEYYSLKRKDREINKVIGFYKMRWAGVRLWVNSLAAKKDDEKAAKKATRYKKILLEYLDKM